MNSELIAACIFIIAVLYSSVGHGGASGYLAVMAIAGISPVVMRSQALILNLFVAGSAFVLFYRNGYFNRSLLTCFAITSVPAAYFGAYLHINPTLYKILLGICLLVAVVRILYRPTDSNKPVRPVPVPLALFIGLALGLLSGMIGIGGGIILSPLLILFRWSTVKESAGVSALFIVLNSLSGLAGIIGRGYVPDNGSMVWIAAALTGGLIGSYTGSTRLPVTGLKYILSGILCFAAVKLMIF